MDNEQQNTKPLAPVGNGDALQKAPTREQIVANNNRSLYVKCKAAQEDLAEVAANFGKNSDEYKKKLKQTMAWFDCSFPDLLELAISLLSSRGHNKSSQTIRTD
ncbi:hypothetical protein [Janthinobacterium sp.]|uniref:hypothetical protein n=1 Tax=Janthinobacterium sp. TaxID=1871054 RepID=UPI00293D9BC1|nr:hypothetical protein [Janthinobacterium sp.]